jgi:hypothetical protein
MPFVIEYVNGMATIVMNAGNASSIRVQSISPTFGHHQIADDGQSAARRRARDHAHERREERAQMMNRMPMTTLDKPVRAPGGCA